jgi:hypothetical protein
MPNPPFSALEVKVARAVALRGALDADDHSVLRLLDSAVCRLTT